MTSILRAARGTAAFACLVAVLIAAPVCAQTGFVPQTENERLLLKMLEQQQQQIQVLKTEVEELKRRDAPVVGTAPRAPRPAAGGSGAEIAADRLDAVDEKVEEVSRVLQSRISAVETRTQDAKVTMTGPGPRIESASGDFAMQVVGVIQADAAGFAQSDRGEATPRLRGGTNLRRLHIGLQGTAFRSFNYTLVYDAATGGSVSSGVRDAFVSYVGLRPFVLTLGQQKPNVGMEPNFSDRSNAGTFMEPGLSANLITAMGTRNIGARLSAGGERYSASLGIFGDDVANNGVASPASEGWGPAGRVTLAPINEPGMLVHAGVSGYWREIGRAGGGTPANPNYQLRYRAQPEVTVDSPRLIDTGVMLFGQDVGVLAAEAAGVYGPFSVQGEWAMSRLDQVRERPTLQFDGGYASVSWFLTGESRVYEGRTGVFTRFAPKANFSLTSAGKGAFELAARWSYLDLNSNPNVWLDNATLIGVRGGRQTDYTVALNWYLNPYLRLMLDYVHASADNFTIPAAIGSGVDEEGDADVLAFRVHQEW